MKVQDIMSRDPSVVSEQASIGLGEALTAALSVRHLPVINAERRLVGIISIRDVLRHYTQPNHNDALPVSDLMTPDPISVSPSTDIYQAAQLMHDNDVSCVPVVDPDGHVIGIVTERNFVGVLLEQHDQLTAL